MVCAVYVVLRVTCCVLVYINDVICGVLCVRCGMCHVLCGVCCVSLYMRCMLGCAFRAVIAALRVVCFDMYGLRVPCVM